jgi:hypothetical protein
MTAQAAEPGIGGELSLTIAYELWLGSWSTALTAVETATQSRSISTSEAAVQRHLIAAERQTVTKQFSLLVGDRLPPDPTMG